MKVSWFEAVSEPLTRQPAPAHLPALPDIDVGALYHRARVGGDFYDFVATEERVLLLLLDIAGQRSSAFDIAASVQELFHQRALELFGALEVNEAEAIIELAHDLNRGILAEADGVRCVPGFIACYNRTVGTLCYINAGHTPGMIREASGVAVLESSGLPLGLFSHGTHEARIYALPLGGVLLLVSRGLVEVRAGREEFGSERVKQSLVGSRSNNAQAICATLLDEVKHFVDRAPSGLLQEARKETDPLGRNDVTTLALVRKATARAATT